jgi:hypothetical protein
MKRAVTVSHAQLILCCVCCRLPTHPNLCFPRSARAAIAAAFPKVVKPVEGEPLVIQYEVKLETQHNCGGMYIKLLKDDPDLIDSLGEFSGDSEYTIMFGPDKCGGTDKVRAEQTLHGLGSS